MNKYFMVYAATTITACTLSGIQKTLPTMDSVFSTPQQRTAAKVTAGLIGSAGVTWASNKIVGDGKGKTFYNGQYAHGFARSLQLSGVCLSIAPMLNEQWGNQFFRFGTRAPIIAGVSIAVAHPTTQQFALNVPFIGEHVSTYKNDNGKLVSKCGDQCNGICNQCFIPKVLVIVGIYKAIDPLVDNIGTWLGKKFGFIQEDEDFS